MVDFSHGPMLYSAIGVGAVLLLVLFGCCCCCRRSSKKDDDVVLTPSHPSLQHNAKHHYALDVDAVMLTSPATRAPPPPPPKNNNITSPIRESYTMITSPMPLSSRSERKSMSRRDPELFSTMRKSLSGNDETETVRLSSVSTTPSPPRKTSSARERESMVKDPPRKSSSVRERESIVKDPPRKSSSMRERESIKEPIIAAPMSFQQGLQPEEFEIMPTSPVQRFSRPQRRSFSAPKESEALPTSPVQRVSSTAGLSATDLEWYTSMPTSPICRPSQRLCKTDLDVDSLTTPPSPIRTPKRKKSVTFEIPDDPPKPTSRASTPRGSMLASTRSTPSVDPLAIAEDPVIVASRLPFETIKTHELMMRDGFGEIYKGTYRDSVVVVKRLLPESRRDLTKIEALLREVKLMAGVDHAHIVQFLGVAWDSFSDVCVVTEFMAGGDLRTALDHFDSIGRPLGFDKQKATIALHVAHALTYLHSLQRVVLYRDIKSKNIVLDEQQTLAKLTNCSVLKEWQDGTMSAGVGTLLWMAPEVMTGEKYDDKADVYSFGVLLSELDTYLLPYADFETDAGDVSTVLLHRILAGKAKVTFSKELRADVRALGESCVQLDPSQRPTSAQVLYELQKIERTMESEISIVL